ncbi:MAG: Sec-independent protein translocase protein TatB [Pseudomonadota bacterium]
MFDIGTSELLIIGIVVLLAVGPKDLPVFLRTVGKYVGAIKKQAGEFRQHFDEALRETELDQLRKDVSGLKTDVEKTVRDATRDIESDVIEAQNAIKADNKPSSANGTSATELSSANGNSETTDPDAATSRDPLALETAEDLAAALTPPSVDAAPGTDPETASANVEKTNA